MVPSGKKLFERIRVALRLLIAGSVCGGVLSAVIGVPLFTIGQVLVFAFGLFCCGMTASIALYFARCRQGIGLSVSRMMVEQVITSTCTLLFAGNSLWAAITGQPAHVWNAISVEAALTLRTVMFLAVCLSSLHLSEETYKIITENEHE